MWAHVVIFRSFSRILQWLKPKISGNNHLTAQIRATKTEKAKWRPLVGELIASLPSENYLGQNLHRCSNFFSIVVESAFDLFDEVNKFSTGFQWELICNGIVSYLGRIRLYYRIHNPLRLFFVWYRRIYKGFSIFWMAVFSKKCYFYQIACSALNLPGTPRNIVIIIIIKNYYHYYNYHYCVEKLFLRELSLGVLRLPTLNCCGFSGCSEVFWCSWFSTCRKFSCYQ